MTGFNKNRRMKDGLDHYCQACRREHLREYRKKNATRNPDEVIIPSEKRCPECGVIRPSSEWRRDRTSPDGLESCCKPCKRAKEAKYYAENGEKVRERRRRWREANREKDRESARRWYKANRDKDRENNRRWKKTNPDRVRAYEHRRRARKTGAFTVPHSPDDLLAYWRFVGVDPDKCWYCALDGRDVPMEHIDHLKPLAAGGSETVWNKRPACAKCNTSKHARVFPAGTGDERAMRIAWEQANLTHLWMVMHNLID